MHTVGTFEAKTHFSALLEQVERGELVIITKHGHPIAKLMPVSGTSKEHVQVAIQSLKAFNLQHTLGGLDWKALRDEGRR